MNSLNGTLNFEVSADKVSLSTILQCLVMEDDTVTASNSAKVIALKNIQDWGVENTTLEQVFINITSEAKADEKKRNKSNNRRKRRR